MKSFNTMQGMGYRVEYSGYQIDKNNNTIQLI